VSVIYTDFISGLVHIVLDCEQTLTKIPFLRIPAKNFQLHHVHPTQLIFEPWYQILFPTLFNGFFYLFITFYYYEELWFHPSVLGWILGNSIIGVSYQWIHQQSHTSDGYHFLLSPSYHDIHHKTFSANFNIVTGHTGFLTNWVYTISQPSPFFPFFLLIIFYFLPFVVAFALSNKYLFA
jgi:hypothetical protein